MSGNFDFLDDEFPSLATFGRQAESYCRSDPNSSLIKIGMLGETIVNLIYGLTGLDEPYDDKAVSKINKLEREGFLPSQVASVLHIMRKDRNKAVHDGFSSSDRATALVPIAYNVCQWFAMAYGTRGYQPRPYVALDRPDAHVENKTSSADDERMAEEARRKANAAPKVSKAERVKRVMAAENQRPKTEAETRVLIDAALREAGWEADTNIIRYSKGSRPTKGHNMAIAEWPTGSDIQVSG